MMTFQLLTPRRDPLAAAACCPLCEGVLLSTEGICLPCRREARRLGVGRG